MADKQLRFVVTGEDRSGSRVLGQVGSKAETTGHKIGSAFSKLGGMIGGEFGAALDEIGTKLETLGGRGMGLGMKLTLAGGAAIGLGGALTMMGAKEKQSSDQLKQAIDNTGNSFSDFKGQIDGAVQHMERFGYRANETKDALTTLTDATHDPQKALDLLGEAADYAAVKHVSLDDAATALARGINGSAKMFKQFGVQIKTNADGTKDYAGANERLAQILHGQASSAADNFNGRLRRLRAEVEDQVAAFGQKYGPAVTALGPVMMATGAAVQFFQHRAAVAAATEAALAAATEAESGAAGENAAANTAAGAASLRAAAANQALAGAEGEAAAGAGAASAAQGGLLATLGRLGPVAAMAAAGGFLEAKSFQAATKEGHKHGGMFGVLSGAMNLVIPGYSIITNKIDGFMGSSKKSTATTKAHAAAVKSDSQALKAVAYDANAASNAISKLNAKYLDAEEASLSFKDAEAQLSQSLKDNGHSLDDNSDKGRANKEAIFQAIHAAQNHADAVWKQTHSVEASTKAFQGDRAELRNTLIQMGFNKTAVNQLIDRYMHIPAHRKTKVDLDADKARHDAQTLLDIINAIPSEKYTNLITNVIKRNANPDMSPNRTAGGSDFFQGGSTMLAEREAELVLPRGDKIVPLSKVQSNGGGSPIHVTVHVAGSVIREKDLVNSIMKGIATVQSRNGKVTIYGGNR